MAADKRESRGARFFSYFEGRRTRKSTPTPHLMEELNAPKRDVPRWSRAFGPVGFVLVMVAMGVGCFVLGSPAIGVLFCLFGLVPAAAVAPVVFVMACYFITADYPVMRCWVTGHMSDNLRSFAGKVRDIFAAAFGGYLKSQVLLSLGVFAILCVGFFAIGQNYGLLLALMLSVLDFIPIVGSGTVMVPWAVVSLIVGDYRKAVELMVVWGVICLFRQLAEPKIVGNQTGLPPILSLMSIYVGMRLGGVLGMVLGPVLTVALLNLVRLGVFRPTAADLRLAARDVTALLQRGRPEEDPPSSGGGA